ncbi:MAG: ABC-F family ATP-binding cassette domain-containing protein [Pleurocapsa sp. MO_192.B19]|nr:ABC-F family ATP-binding cassette domain-containing protein [Pleurocapsa sp. MO_192.B19]
MKQNLFLQAHNITYQLPSGRILFSNINIGVRNGDRVGLVGCNGVGKSTLLKILAGQLKSSQGFIDCNSICSLYYLPQITQLEHQVNNKTIGDFVSSSAEEWWKIINILESDLNTCLDLYLPISSLSGGELTKLFLALGLAQKPNLLLLDEPTNHMDILACENLSGFLNKFSGAFIIVSHQSYFLELVVNNIWELTPTKLNYYGGNFSFYRQEKEREFQSAIKAQEKSRKALVKARKTVAKEQKRAARSQREGRIQARVQSISAIQRGYNANKASASAGKFSKKSQKILEKAEQNYKQAKIKTKKDAQININASNKNHTRELINIRDATLLIGNKILAEQINLEVKYGDRIVIAGANGCGKSSLIEALFSKNSAYFRGGNISINKNLNYIKLDQKYQIIEPQKTILENITTRNPSLDYQLIRLQLGHFLFKNQDVYKLASTLSGGELARLALAIITISETDLLILDEPTNNLDLDTSEQFIGALKSYRGAILVISHDLDFLNKLDITQSFIIKNQKWQLMSFLPQQREEYRHELIHS